MLLGTSLRQRPVAETEVLARRLMAGWGITRVTDLTPLDVLGVPVYSSIRPGGVTQQVHSGKGLHATDARTGALMEALEYAVAEHASSAGPDALLTPAALVRQLPGGLQLADLAPRLGVMPARQLAAVRCEELVSGRSAMLPAELVLLPAPPDDAPPLFGWSTNGLASGNTLEEATLHALFELLERDALAMNLARDESRPLPPAGLPPPFDAWAADWRRRGVVLTVRFMPSEFGLPCFEAALHEPARRNPRLARGWGLHASRHIALARAICEAAQSRLAVIRGGRDDVPALQPTVGPRAAGSAGRLLERLRAAGRELPFDEVPELRVTSVRAALRDLRARLAAGGIHHVFRRRMLAPGGPSALHGLQVVKVIVPRLESALQPHARMGPRLLARVMSRADA